MSEKQRRAAYGDFQTPEELALQVCRRLHDLGMRPDTVVEPTCGVGAFVLAAAQSFPAAKNIFGFEINPDHLDTLSARLSGVADNGRIHLERADFFAADWNTCLADDTGELLVLGNLPWVTNAALGRIGSDNLPEKANFQNHSGMDAITGKANFDISEWMLLTMLRWFDRRRGSLAMLVKTAVARKVLAYAEQQALAVADACLVGIDAKRHFGAAVDACLLVVRFAGSAMRPGLEYTVFDSLDDRTGKRVGHRAGLTVGDLDAFDTYACLLGDSPQKWRSGVKHDAAAVMEFNLTPHGLENGRGETVDLEPDFLYPLMKGSDVAGEKIWRGKYVLVTQRNTGESTAGISLIAPKTWRYLETNRATLDARRSSIYAKNPRFSIFGIGDYAFRPWRIAICSLYKKLTFRLVGPLDGRPVMFDDTVYYLSFDTAAAAQSVLECLDSEAAQHLLASMIFWDEKRPIKTGILNRLDWTRLANPNPYPTRGRDLFDEACVSTVIATPQIAAIAS